MKKKSGFSKEKLDILYILINSDENHAHSIDEIHRITGLSRDKVRKIIYILATKDKHPIALKTEAPYGFYMRNEEI